LFGRSCFGVKILNTVGGGATGRTALPVAEPGRRRMYTRTIKREKRMRLTGDAMLALNG
jgi:hypothetical protein